MFYFIKNNIIIKNVLFVVMFGVVVGMKINMVLKYWNFSVNLSPYLILWVGDAFRDGLYIPLLSSSIISPPLIINFVGVPFILFLTKYIYMYDLIKESS